jgi:hypothetical protein
MDKVLPKIITGITMDEIPGEDFRFIFLGVMSASRIRPDYFRVV